MEDRLKVVILMIVYEPLEVVQFDWTGHEYLAEFIVTTSLRELVFGCQKGSGGFAHTNLR